MHHHGSVAQVEVESDCDFIVYSHSLGLVGQCSDMASARDLLRGKLHELNAWNISSDLAVFRWSDGRWVPAMSPYEIQEWEIEQNPPRTLRYL